MTNYFFGRLLPNTEGELRLHILFTDNFDSAHNWSRHEPPIQHSVQDLVESVNQLDTTDVTTMVLDIDHSFNCNCADDSGERISSLNLVDEFFNALPAMKPLNLFNLELQMDDRVGLTSADAFRITQKVAEFRSQLSSPFPSLKILGQSASYNFLMVDISRLTTLTQLTLNLVEVDGHTLTFRFLPEATNLRHLRLKDVVITHFNRRNLFSPALAFYHWLSNESSIFVTTELHLENRNHLVRRGVHNFQFDADWVRNKHQIARAHEDVMQQTGLRRLVKMVENLSRCNETFQVQANKTRAAYYLLRQHYAIPLVSRFMNVKAADNHSRA